MFEHLEQVLKGSSTTRITCCIIFGNFKLNCVRFEVFTVMNIKITVSWHKMLCTLVERY